MNEIVLKNNIKNFRQEKNISQEELAKIVGTTRQTIISIEKGNYHPSAKLALLICFALNKTFEEVFYF
ncbi:MAG: helix-turn-helix transcriptional regulator [Clostridia bacterium]|nr:helix-turn-helix transcriptional regulator [Clostridia bacterium]